MDGQSNQITPEDKLTVLCEITIDGKDIQQSGKVQVQSGIVQVQSGIVQEQSEIVPLGYRYSRG